jgi:DnaJ family protein A protein 5
MDDDSDADLNWAVGEGNAEEWECVACGKSFRSEAAWDSHERSKKHMREIEKLKREMRQEDEAIGLGAEDGEGKENEKVDGDSDGEFTPPSSPTPPASPTPPETVLEQGEPDKIGLLAEESSKDNDQSVHKKGKKKKSKPQARPSDGVTAPPSTVPENGNAPQDATSSQPELTKREKRKLREARKAVNPEPERGIIVCTYSRLRRLVH